LPTQPTVHRLDALGETKIARTHARHFPANAVKCAAITDANAAERKTAGKIPFPRQGKPALPMR